MWQMGAHIMHAYVNCKILLGISISVIILLAQTSSVAAVNDQDLVWGIKVNDRFDYNVEIGFHNASSVIELDTQMYVIIDELNTITDHATSLGHLAMFSLAIGSYTTYWSNGSVMDSLWLDELNQLNPIVAYPVGNWTLLTELFEAANPYAEVIQNSTMLNHTRADYPFSGNVISMVFQKSTGIPQSILYNVTWDGTITVYVKLTLIRSTTTQTDLLYILGGLVVVVVIVIVIVFIRRK
jgi:hypothetical protein